MDTLEDARERLRRLCHERRLARGERVVVRPLSPDQAIGPGADADFAIKKGKERVIEATFGEARGQAFTDTPSQWAGTLDDAFALDLACVRHRAVFVAVLNALLRRLGVAAGTVHCRNDDPQRCGPELAEGLAARFGHRRVGVIGLQPAILRSLVDRLGADAVRVLDLNPENIGTRKSGVLVGDGETGLAALVEWCELGLATGSSLVNATIDGIRRRFAEAGKPVVFFGNTISGAAALLGLERICPFGR